MTCVWDGIIKKLKLKMTPVRLLQILQEKNVLTHDVTINDESLTDLQLKENFNAINELSIKHLNKGYDCSTSDPLLLLVAQIYKVTIVHDYNGTEIIYKHKKSRMIIKFESSDGHFW